MRITRRSAAAGLGAAALMPLLARGAQTAGGIIDVHHHFIAPFLKGANAGDWGIDKSLAAMDQNGVATAVLSPATSFAEPLSGAELLSVTRRVNEFAAETARTHPKRYGQFVYAPLPDVDGALKEIAYGLDTLKASGVVFVTNYGARTLSDSAFAPVWAELDRRGAVAYVHPRAGACCEDLFPQFPAEANWLEIPYDTGRAVVTLLLTGVFRKYRNIKWIFSHSGGAVPMFAGRMRNMSARADLSAVAPDGIDAELARLHYETANGASRPTLSALMAFVPISQILFGTDHPYVSVAANLRDLRSNNLSSETLAAITSGNAPKLIPGLTG